ncbi:MAG: polysaccharide biosynthesis tyrosine autokinase, partial [Loktanella sp.]|nr:polysaccharide biosynthesis tyrosine autokinase [Loktanella sp.]
EVEATRTLYETFLTRLKEITVQRGLQQADSRVLSDAMPGGQVAPRATLIQALALVLGSMVGAGLILIRNFMYSSFRTSEELEAATGLFVMGQIPRMPIKRRGELLPYLSDKPTSAAAEAIRNVRTSILLSNIDMPPKVIMTTSSVPEEGKTTAAIALAHNFSGMGKKVLLIEGDIRRRRFQEFFKVRPKTGLIATLSDETPFDQSIFHDEHLGADVLMAERSRVNAADFFSSDRFRDFLTEMREIYDIILIDTPPVLVVPDARVIGQYVDATIFLVAWDKTQRGQVTAALRDLESVNLDVAGLVLSQVDRKGMQKYGYGKGYYYGKAYYESE